MTDHTSAENSHRSSNDPSPDVEEPLAETFFDNAVAAAAQEAGQFSPALAVVEVWVFDERQNRLVLQKGGCWTCPSLGSEAEELKNGDVSVPPGVDLAGTLWTTSQSSSRRSCSGKLHWQSLEALINDPDTAKGGRLAQLRDLGLDHAAGIPYQADGHSGMVIYISKADATHHVVDNEAHDTYLHRAASFLGTTVALSKAKKSLLESSEHIKHAIIHSLEDSPVDCRCCCSGEFCNKIATVARKARGGGMAIPPPMTTEQALWTWLGSFSTLLVLSGINHALVTTTDQSLLIGPFGALMTLQYGLTGAPASQPRNAILGQAVAGAIALAFTYIPVPVWLQQALGPAFSVAAMCRLGIPHPPAGAHGTKSMKRNLIMFHVWVLSYNHSLVFVVLQEILTLLYKPSCMLQAATSGPSMELSSCARLSVASWLL